MVPREFSTKLPFLLALKAWVKVWTVRAGLRLTVVPGPPVDVAAVGKPVEVVEVAKVPLLPVMLAWAPANVRPFSNARV